LLTRKELMNDRLLVATRKGLFMLERRKSWDITRTAFLGDPVSMLLSDPRSDTLHVALNLGHFGVKMHRSRDGGESWHETPAPSYPAQPDDAEGPAWSLVQVWSLEAGGDDRPGLLWAGTMPGGLFRSDDHGDSWTLVDSLWERPERLGWFGGGADSPGIHSICVDPRDTRRVTVAISCGGVWQSEDRGESWSLRGAGLHAAYMPPERAQDPNIQDPHRMVACPAAPDVFWLQHHNGVFRSVDTARSWRELAPTKPPRYGFPVAVHPRDPDTAWLVPAASDESRFAPDGAVCVYRTRDGGASFEALRGGLPQEHAYHLVYRHALDIDASGECLVMGSTTGGLWLSENGGENWHTLGLHLPPIYAVRFG
jgi:hypothetical protein